MNKILDKYIRSTGFSQKEIAEMIGVSPQLMNHMVKHPDRLRPSQIKNIAEAVGRSPRNLFSLIINN